MSDFDFIDQLVTSPSIRYRLKYYIVAIAILFSVGIYRYLIDYFQKEEDFISVFAEILPFNFTTYKFFAHSQDDEVSIYSRFSKAVTKESEGKMSIEPRGKKGNAIENAYGVLNSAKAFGIIQSDTYLSVDFLNNPEKVQIITPLYMERLHILVADTTDMVKDIKVISSENKNSVKVIEDAINKGTLYAGRFNSSSRILLPHLLRQWQIDASYKLSDLPELGMKEMLDRLKDTVRGVPYPRIAILFVGSSDEIINAIDGETISVKGLAPNDIHDLNELRGVDLDITNFGDSYNQYNNITTAGAMATLIGSTDLTSSELHEFILILKEIYENPEIKSISSNPPVLIDDIKDFLEKENNNKWVVFFRSLLIFLVSVTVTSFIVATMLLNISSYVKQSRYYKNIYRVYRLVMLRNKNQASVSDQEHDEQYQKAIRLIEGMTALEKIGQSVREDYSTGGITTKHHQYLLDNSNHVFQWFESKLVNRLSFVIEKTPKEPSRVSELKENLLKWHSNGMLSISSYNALIEKFN